jgi:hypothetical protein
VKLGNVMLFGGEMAFILNITTTIVKKYLDISGSEVRGHSSNNCGKEVAAGSSQQHCHADIAVSTVSG